MNLDTKLRILVLSAIIDYPKFIIPAAAAVANSLADFAIVLGGSGNGEAQRQQS